MASVGAAEEADGAAPVEGKPSWSRRIRDGARGDLPFLMGVAAAAALIALTVVVFTGLPRYHEPGRSLAGNLDFGDGFAGWQTGGTVTRGGALEAGATLENRDPDGFVYLYRQIALPPGRTDLLVAAEVATVGVKPGEAAWHRARIFFVQEAADGTFLWYRPNSVVMLEGSTGRREVRRVFRLPAAARHGLLGIELAHATGSFSVGGLRVEALDERLAFRLFATLAVAGWCLLAAWVGARVFYAIELPWLRRVLAVASGLALAGILMPIALHDALVNTVAIVAGLGPAAGSAAGHALIFLVLSALVRFGRGDDPLLYHATGWLMVAVASEVLQLFTADRAPSPTDVVADTVGVAFGLAVAELALRVDRAVRAPRAARPGTAPHLP